MPPSPISRATSSADETAPYGPPGLATRQVARRALKSALRGTSGLDEALENALEADAVNGETERLARRDRAFARVLVGTALRRRGQIDDALVRFIERPIPEHSGIVMDLLHIAAAQILFLDTPPHAAVSLAVADARTERRARPYAGLVNAVLRRLVRDRTALLARQDPVCLNAPAWLRARWSAAYGAAGAARIAAMHTCEPYLDLAFKTPEAVQAFDAEMRGSALTPLGGRLPGAPVRRLAPRGAVTALPGYAAGDWWVQDVAASLPVRLMGDVAGRRVLDMCAAPGGKTAQLAAAGAEVTALDRSPRRLVRLAANLERLSLSAHTQAIDALDFRSATPFDAVLLDAPCSATGTIRRRPDIAWRRRKSDLTMLVDLQSRLLRHAIRLMKPGGVLVFATCSLEPEEGEALVATALRTEPGLTRLPAEPPEVGGLTEAITAEGDIRILPYFLENQTSRLSGMDGFFIARLIYRPPR